MKIQAIAHFINGTTLASKVIDTEEQAASQEASHDEVLAAFAEVVDFWSDMGSLSKFTMEVDSGATMSINVKHVTHIEIIGFNESEALAAQERIRAGRQSVRRRSY